MAYKDHFVYNWNAVASPVSTIFYLFFFLETNGMKYICNLFLLCSDLTSGDADTSVTN